MKASQTDLDEIVILKIARKSGVSEAEVRDAYEHALKELGSDAHIKDYVHLLAMKRVRQQFLPKSDPTIKNKGKHGAEVSPDPQTVTRMDGHDYQGLDNCGDGVDVLS